MIYYHNPRCQKSRGGLTLLQERGLAPTIRKYLDDPLTPEEFYSLLDKLELPASDLIRTSEAEWKEHFQDKELQEDELILAMIEFPKLMQRPILETINSAALGRPPERLLEIL